MRYIIFLTPFIGLTFVLVYMKCCVNIFVGVPLAFKTFYGLQ
jgi:hypothetical protein